MNAPWVRRLALGLVVGWLAGVLAAAQPAAASTPPRWGEPAPVGGNLPSSWFPDIQADPAGAIRLAWAADLAEGDNNLTHSLTGAVMLASLEPSGWSQPRDLQVLDAGTASRPLIASDGTYAHMIFRTGSGGTVRLVYTRAPLTAELGNAHSWSEPRPLSDDNAYYAQIAILPDGALVVIYNAVPPPPLVARTASPTAGQRPSATPVGTPEVAAPPPTIVLSRRSIDHGITWSPPTQLSRTDERIGRTTLAVTPDGAALIAAWDEGYDNLTGQGEPHGVGTALSVDGGASWGAQRTIRSSLGPVEQASVVIGGDGPFLVYRATGVDRLFYRTGVDGGRDWSAERPVPGGIARPYTGKHNFDKLGLAVDGDGRILLAYIGTDASAPKGLAVMVATYHGGAWTEPVRVAAPDGYPEYPRLAVALGNRLQLVYFVRDKQFEVGHYLLYAVAGQSDARAIPPASPAPAPVLVPTAVARPVPAVQLQPYPSLPAAPTPLPAGAGPLHTPQAEVTRPALGALVATLVALGLIMSVLLISRWLRLSLRARP